jgi:hypothetical protein
MVVVELFFYDLINFLDFILQIVTTLSTIEVYCKQILLN